MHCKHQMLHLEMRLMLKLLFFFGRPFLGYEKTTGPGTENKNKKKPMRRKMRRTRIRKNNTNSRNTTEKQQEQSQLEQEKQEQEQQEQENHMNISFLHSLNSGQLLTMQDSGADLSWALHHCWHRLGQALKQASHQLLGDGCRIAAKFLRLFRELHTSVGISHRMYQRLTWLGIYTLIKPETICEPIFLIYCTYIYTSFMDINGYQWKYL